MSNFFKSAILFITLLALTGCSILLPSSNNPILFKEMKVNGSVLEADKAIDAYLITPTLLKQLAPVTAVAKNNVTLDRQIENYQYQVGVGDVLNVTVWEHPELTTPAGSYRTAAESGNQVHPDGTIFYPYVGKIKVVGLTINQIRQQLTNRLANYIMDPQLEVSVVSYKSKKAYITGEVKTPGQQFISNIPLTLLDAVNNAGGLSDNADWNRVTITHAGRDEIVSLEALIQRGDLTQNRLLNNGDIVHIPRNDTQKVFIVGEVNKPQFLTIGRNGMTLMEAISASGGIDKFASDATGIFVIRGMREGKETVITNEGEHIEKIANIYQLDVTNPVTYILGTEFFLKPYDIVYVTTAPITRWNRVISQIVPTLSGFNNVTESMLRVRNW